MTPRSTCPPAATLSAWLDEEVSGTELQQIRDHLAECEACRAQAAGWVDAVHDLGLLTSSEPEHDSPFDKLILSEVEGLRAGSARLTACLDEEALTAYSEADLSSAQEAHAEQHLLRCTRCTAEVRRLIGLRIALGEGPERHLGASDAEVVAAQSTPALAASPWAADLADWLRSIGRTLTSPWPALGAVAATALVAIVIARFVPFGTSGDDVGFRGGPAPQRVEVVVDQAPGHARPGDGEPVAVMLSRGTTATQLERSRQWTRVELADGRRVWVRAETLASGPLP